MLVLKHKSAGFTLIEMMIVVVILAIVSSMAYPSFREMIINSQVRNATESIVNGLQKARAEAVARNTNVSFILGAGTSWTVSVVNPASTIETRNSSEGSAIVTLTAVAQDLVTAATSVTFNNFGGIVNPTTDIARLDITAPNANKPLRVQILAGGTARMCDPSLSVTTNPRGC
jgi:type IV fimbrial biogenesis protein FimT